MITIRTKCKPLRKEGGDIHNAEIACLNERLDGLGKKEGDS